MKDFLRDFWRDFFTDDGFMPHGHCYFWTPDLVWLHVICDGLITLSYYSIPITLFIFVRKRRDLEFRWMFGFFATFILTCGTTHLLEIWNVWHSYYWLSGAVKAVTAAASVVTAILLIRLLPEALALPSPKAMKRTNETLEREIAQRRAAEDEAKALNAELEARVEARTGELHAANAELLNEIRERRQVDAQLSQLGQLIEHSRDFIAMADLTGKLTFMNSGARQMIGMPAERPVETLNIADYVAPPWQEFFHQTVLAATREKGLWEGEMQLVHLQTGEQIDVARSMFLLRDTDSAPSAYAMVTRDITARNRSIEALRRSEARLHAVTENLREGLLISDMAGNLLHWNRACLEIHGFRNLEEGQRQLQEFTTIFELSTLEGRVLPFSEWPMQRVLSGERLQNCVLRIRHLQAGWQRVFSYTGTFLRDVGEEPLAFLATVDITERKQAEDAIQQLNAELEDRVNQRTEQLLVANKELEAFSYSVSHDLRAPLRAIDGFSKALLEDFAPLLPEDGRRYLDYVRRGAQKMGNLIDDLLTFSRLSRLPLQMRAVDMRRLAAQAMEDLHPDCEGREVELRLADLPPCQGDPALLKQVWMNLLSNALKYSRKRPVAIIEIEGHEENGTATYRVRDNGSGFDMRYASKLFGVFQRLHRAEEFEGTGVGLAIVQRVVHRHGGEVSAESVPDVGATFSFTLKAEPKL